ncbi:hypothetical protein [Dactylosporangium sp. NPDC051484]|uniref:hypothetical protein n=1 Tax=Dactylosporangium sp. NPDC051484 TaxID=3154942 RepID=UPI00344DA8DA
MDAQLTETVLAALGIAGMPEVLPPGLVRVDEDERVRLTGFRAGRQVEIRNAAGTTVTWVRAAAADLQALGNAAGAFVVDAGAPPAGAAALASLAAVRQVWRDVRVRCGAGGLVAVRRSGASGYLYDLWLLELLADTLDAAPLPFVDAAAAEPPYRSV